MEKEEFKKLKRSIDNLDFSEVTYHQTERFANALGLHIQLGVVGL